MPVEEEISKIIYPEYENPFKMSSDEWDDRSFINSLIHNIKIGIELCKDTIKDDEEYIKKDIERGFYPNITCEHVKRNIDERVNKLVNLKDELRILTNDSLTDKEKLERYWTLRNVRKDY